ncbi:type III secretion system chaperone [Pseudochelatococcus sp. B33]
MYATAKHELLLKAFGKTIGIDDLAFNARNDVRIVFNDRAVDIRYDSDRDMVLVAATIADIAAADTSFVFANILELNLAHALTGNGTVGFDRRENKLHYVNYIAIGGLDAAAFSGFMVSCLRTIELWVKAVGSRAFFEQPVSFGNQSAGEQSAVCRA